MREESKFRVSDEKIESINNQFLEKYFYNVLTEKFIRNTNKKLQISGIDTIFIYGGIQYCCDEKVAAHYINKPLHTFAFELSFIDRAGQLRDGWFLDNKKQNDCYLLCWIDEAKVDKPKSIDDIISGEIILIRKDKLLEYLETVGWDINRLRIKAKEIRFDGNSNFGNLKDNGVKFSFSNNLVEKPINLIIPRDILRLDKYSTLTLKIKC